MVSVVSLRQEPVSKTRRLSTYSSGCCVVGRRDASKKATKATGRWKHDKTQLGLGTVRLLGSGSTGITDPPL